MASPLAPPSSPPPEKRSVWTILPAVITAVLLVVAAVVLWYRNLDVGAIVLVLGVVALVNWLLHAFRYGRGDGLSPDLD